MKLLSFTILATLVLALFIPNIDATSNVRGGCVEEKENIGNGHGARLVKEKPQCVIKCQAEQDACLVKCKEKPALGGGHVTCKDACKMGFESCKTALCADPTKTH
jgi:hypothetical protein